MLLAHKVSQLGVVTKKLQPLCTFANNSIRKSGNSNNYKNVLRDESVVHYKKL